ncbi:MAG: hypothetical protein R3Y29_01270 [bacterium]
MVLRIYECYKNCSDDTFEEMWNNALDQKEIIINKKSNIKQILYECDFDYLNNFEYTSSNSLGLTDSIKDFFDVLKSEVEAIDNNVLNNIFENLENMLLDNFSPDDDYDDYDDDDDDYDDDDYDDDDDDYDNDNDNE